MKKEFDVLSEAIRLGDIEAGQASAKRMLESGMDPVEIFSACVEPTLNDLGEKFSVLEIFLPELMIAADVVDAVQEVVAPVLKKRGGSVSKGVGVIATVYGDLHDIGKNMVSLMMAVNGIDMHDMGVDVSPQNLVKKAEEVNADLLCLSGLMMPSMPFMRETIELARASTTIGKKIKIMVGGGPVTESWSVDNGCDGYADDAIGAVRQALLLLPA